MIVEKRDDDGFEIVLRGVEVEAIPENRFAGFGAKSGRAISTAGGDEIDCVVAIPVFETMLVFEIFFALVGTFAKHE